MRAGKACEWLRDGLEMSWETDGGRLMEGDGWRETDGGRWMEGDGWREMNGGRCQNCTCQSLMVPATPVEQDTLDLLAVERRAKSLLGHEAI